jgi:hypothetical protein
MAKVHAYIVSHLRSQFGVFGKEKTQKKLLANILDEFKKIKTVRVGVCMCAGVHV